MKDMKKLLIITAIVVAAIVIAGASLFFFGKKGIPADSAGAPKDTGRPPMEQTASKETGGNPSYVGDDFTFIPPTGWIQVRLPGTLVSYQNPAEIHPKGSPADKINFKSYIAVSFDNANGQALDAVVNLVKRQTQSVVPAIVFTSINDGMVGGQPAKFLEADLLMQDVDFKVMVAVVLKGDKYFTISYNTTAEKWPEYRDMFYNVAASFKFKNDPSAPASSGYLKGEQ